MSYEPLSSSSSTCLEKEEHDELLQEIDLKIKKSKTHAFSKTFAQFALSIIALTISGMMLASSIWLNSRLSKTCWDRHTYFSPASREVDLEYHDVRFNGTLTHPSQYRGSGPAVDDEWNKLERIHIMKITEEDLVASGNDMTNIHLPEEFGGELVASLEVIHQLHCLNFLRKSTFYNFQYYQDNTLEFTDGLDMVHIHLDHCIEMLRQKLMCDADVGMIGYHWVKGYNNPYPVFNTMHKCRNFDSIIGFARQHALVYEPGLNKWSPTAEDYIWDSPP